MGKKYLETKKNTLESSILGVWKTAIEEGDARMDGRTKQYREHRKKLESRRVRKEEVELDEAKYDLYHKDFSSAMQHAYKMAKKLHGITVDPKEIDDKVASGPRKPSEGKTNTYRLKGDKGAIQVQVYNKGGNKPYELNFYKEEVEIEEASAQVLAHGGKGQYKVVSGPAKDGSRETVVKFKGKVVSRGDFDSGADGWFMNIKGKKGQEFFDSAQKMADYFAKNKIKEEVDLEEAAVNPKDREELDKSPSDTAKKMKRAKDPAPNQMAEAQSGDKEAYKKFFDAALKKFKVSSPAELKDDQKKKFYDYIDKNWEGDNEKAEGAMSQVREFKIQSMKAALAQIWGMEEGKNPFAEHKGTKPHKHPHEDNEVEEGLEDSPNSANKQHLCAKNVVHEEWGSGQCISTQHADPDEEGNVAWYDVMFEHGIEKGVSINELKVTKAEGHMHASHDPKKKMKKEMSKTETGKKPAEIDLKPKLADK